MSNLYVDVLEDLEAQDTSKVLELLESVDKKSYAQKIMDGDLEIESVWESALED